MKATGSTDFSYRESNKPSESGFGRKAWAIVLAISFMLPASLVILPYMNSSEVSEPATSQAGYGVMDPGGFPHFFGPYGNYANSPVPTGSVTTLTLVSGGTRYSHTPVVTISDVWGTGSGATASVTVVRGVISSLTLTNGGTGYSAPIVTITDPTGSGASATAAIGGALTGGIRKFVDALPGLGEANANGLGKYISIAIPDTVTYPGCDYYEIAVVRHVEKMHTDLPPTLLNEYVQLETSVNYAMSKHVALTNPNGSAILLANGTQAVAVDNPHYLGPIIVGSRDVPVRIKFSNLLPIGAGGNLFIPVDTTVMGSGMGNLGMVSMVMISNGGGGYTSAPTVNLVGGGGMGATATAVLTGDVVTDVVITDPGMGYSSAPAVEFTGGGGGSGAAATTMIMYENYTENRATLHLHGGATPWISDGTPHQWTTPAGEMTQYPKGVSVQYVPDMWFVNGSVIPNTVGVTDQPVVGASNNPGDGSLTFYYTNQQSARLMFYHDHAYGITRLNVYSGEAAGYLLTDQVENSLINAGIIPSESGAYLYGIPLVIQDKTFVDATTIAYQDPTWNWGSNPGTPVTGDLWMSHVYMPNQNPYDVSGANPYGRWDYGPWFFPPTTGITYGPVPNPYYDPINAPWEPPLIPGVPRVSAGMEAFEDTPVINGQAYPYLDVEPKAYRFRILNAANDRFFNLQMYIADPSVTTSDGRNNTEVAMVPAVTTAGFPATWPSDGRVGGVPDPAMQGPSWIQIGNEGGFLPYPAVIPNQPVSWNYNMKTFNFGNVQDHSLLLGSAERADVIVDFSQYAGKTIIIYNDAPAGFPAYDPRSDYYTGSEDQTSGGGAPPTQAGYGPNTRTIMQIRVANDVPAPQFDLNALDAAFTTTPTHTGVFKADQDPVIVPNDRYDAAYGMSFATDTYARIWDTNLTFKTMDNTTMTVQMQPKAIHDEMGGSYDVTYGRMSGSFGLEVPSGTSVTQQFIPLGYASPPTDILVDSMTPMSPVLGDGTQIWKITHNGVDTHAVHWHLFMVQVINRVAWDNTMMLPDDNELGWKETLRVDPLSDTIVAMRPVAPKLPWEVPNSERLIDPTLPDGAQLLAPPGGFFDPNANSVTVYNRYINYGWEYVTHCHLLEHEEMDMMHAMPVAVAPWAPKNLNGTISGTLVNLTWTDGSIAETAYILQRNTTVLPWTTIAMIDSPWNATGHSKGTTFYYNDTVVADGTSYYYRVLANEIVGDPTTYGPGIGYPTVWVNSTPSNVLLADTLTNNVTVFPPTVITPPNGTSAPPEVIGPTPTTAYLAQLMKANPMITPTYTAHAPIRIDSNADFNIAHGVSSGSGTSLSPWVIDSLSINGDGYGYCIYVGNTTDYFIIRNCDLNNAYGVNFQWDLSPESGIVFNNVTNGIAANNNLWANPWAGVYALNSSRLVIFNQTSTGNYMGIYLSSTNLSVVSFNALTDNYAGAWLVDSNSNLLSDNSIVRNHPGISAAASYGNDIRNNTMLTNIQYGVWMHSSAKNKVHFNHFTSNNGANLTYSSANIQAYDDGNANFWNVSGLGNFWSDWTGPDANADGIVDVPYVIGGGAGAMDFYPIASPTCFISGPTSAPTMLTNFGWIKLAGSAYDTVPLTSVTWSNSRGGSGTAYMTPTTGATTVTWQSRGNLQLFAGVNVITAVAHDALSKTAADVLTVTLDTTPPVVTITSPTSSPTYLTNLPTITLGGSATDVSGIASVVWRNIATATSGTATGLASWGIPDIALVNGTNLIYVNATDKAGNKASDAIWVTMDNSPPTVTITYPTTSPTLTTPWYQIYLKGTATDNVKVTSVVWTNSLGGSGTMYMTPQYGGPSVSWQTRGNIVLYHGNNVITVTAYDNWGNAGTDTITVTYTGV